jgi:hypothetical protein
MLLVLGLAPVLTAGSYTFNLIELLTSKRESGLVDGSEAASLWLLTGI